jgi:hypothetical protein
MHGLPSRRMRQKISAGGLRKGSGADPTASGSTRIAGSLNFKTKYAPAFPRVEIIHPNAGNVTSCSELDRCGFVARAEEPQPPRTRVSKPSDGRVRWPSYLRCIQGAPKAQGEDRPDVSRADFTWARTDGERYAVLTAENAARYVDRESQAVKSTLVPHQ